MGRLKGVSNKSNSMFRDKAEKLNLLKNKLTKRYGENYAVERLKHAALKAERKRVQFMTNQAKRFQKAQILLL